MGLTLLVAVAAFVIGRLLGGSGGRPRLHRLDGVPLLVAAFVVQLSEPLVGREIPYSYPLTLAISATLLVQVAARNIRVPGVGLAAIGLVANAAVVIVNGAMPVSDSAVARAGISAAALALESDPRHEPLDGNTRLAVLADRIPVPIPGRREVDSVGDVALAAGVGLFVFTAMYRRRGVFDPDSGIMTPWAPERC